MADQTRKVTVLQSSPEEDDLPLPPPPPVPPRPLNYEGPSSLSSLPLPPPKETFSTFYQQRQKNELKRLFKHIHPDLRASLDDAVDDEIMKAVQSENTEAADADYQGEVQSMRWIFENWTLDSIGDPHSTKKLMDNEELKGGDVRSTSTMFEHIDSTQLQSAKRQISVRGDVRTSMWLFETQPLDSLNRSVNEEGELVEAVLKEPVQPGDVRGTRLLFESKALSDLGRCNSIEDYSFLKLRSELQELKGDVQKTVKLFQAEPCCAIRDNSGNMHEIKSICREEIDSSGVCTARWLFETQPLDLISKGTDVVKIIRGISLEEGQRGGVDRKRWMFETESFDRIPEVVGENTFEGAIAECTGEVDVINKKKFFEMKPLAAGNMAEKSLEKGDVIGGDVKTSLWLFETQPMETLSDSYEVGSLKKITLSPEEQGEVKDKKQLFESCSIQKSTSLKEQVIEKGDVKGFKELFEKIPLSKIAPSGEEITENEESIAVGNVKGNREIFETTPLYAIKDSSGNLHKVTTVSREEFTQGKVKNYKWMFETKPLDQLVEGKANVEVIKGITRQEDNTGDVKTAKWLFETQTIDGIHSKFNQTKQNSSLEEEPHKGDVKTCKWLFETQPMDILYDKSEKTKDKEAIEDTNVKSITWLFESQPLDSIKDGEKYNLKLCSTIRDSVQSEVGVQTVKHLFETEALDRIRKDTNSEQNLRCVSQVNFQSGEVSRVKELFESQSLDEIGSEIVAASDQQNQGEQIEKGSVNKFTWMFENCPMSQINKDNNDTNTPRVESIESGDVQKKKFIFETSSLDKIHDEPVEQNWVNVEQPVSNIDVKSSTMMFESLPLYAIRDKEGQFHEVTTLKKEEVMSGDVRGARWMFETKPLDAIKAENEVYVIRAVTQEDVKKGDVKSARWKFETQPLDSLTSRDELSVRVTEDFGSSNVQLNKQLFESEQQCKKFVRMVSVTDVQRGDVRTSTWLFENQTIDSLKGEPEEQGPVKAVHREDSQKGDVKRCTWLFESQPLDKIKEPEETSVQSAKDIPKADVKCTTWLFETTPLDKITANSLADTLSYLNENAFVHSSGIIIEADGSRNVNMAKYMFENKEGVQIEKEDVVEGNIRNIMLQLLVRPTLKPQVTLLRETEKGKVNITVVELPVSQATGTVNIEHDQRLQNIAQVIDDLLIPQNNLKKGIIMQETAAGQAEMSVYSLICNYEIKTESLVTERGDVKSTIGNLLATASCQRIAASCRVDETEKGNVNLYKSCIEKGDLHYLKSLHTEASEDEADQSLLTKEQIETVQGGVREAKRSLYQQKEQAERSISDVLPGDVKNTKKVFSSECSVSVDSCVPKEEIVPGDVKATMQSLERAKQQSMSQKEVIISGDVKAAKRSLEMAKQQSMQVEREVIIPGKIYNLNMACSERSKTVHKQSQSPAGPVNGEEVSLEKSKNQPEKLHVTLGQEEGGDQKKPVGRTNSLKGSDKQAEKAKGKLGSWSKGKSPLSKLFTSSGNDKTNKAEQKDARKADVKPSSGLLGRLLQSSSEKAEDVTKSAAQDKRRDETHVDDKKTENEKGSVTKDAQKEEDPSKVPPQEQALQSDITDKLQSPEPDALNNDCRSSEPSSLSMISSETGDDLTSIAQTDAILTDDQESHSQSSEATNLPVSDLEIESKDLDPAAQLLSTPHGQSNSELIPEKGDDALNDVFGDSVTSPFADPLATEIKTDESAQQLNKHDPPAEGGGSLSSGMLFDLNHNGAQDSSDFFGLPDTPSTFSTSMTDTALLEPASTQSSSLVDSGPISFENEAIIGMSGQLTIPDSTPISQDVSQPLDPFGSEKQTSEQGFDIFSSNDDLFNQPPPVNVLDHGGTAFPDDIFGSSNVSNSADVFTGLPSGQAAQSSLDDLFGSEASSVVAPPAQMDLFADDIFGSEAQLLPVSEPGGANVLADSLLASEENNTEQKSENSSWMDDLLG
uniref:Xin actin binding repeat containing 1 n=1 Tax=Neolamprologus brichardi TaxID=32507 RepID=A0A3Q4HKX3_NEOBR